MYRTIKNSITMKNGKFLKSVLFAFLAIATLSCSDDDSNPPQSNTILCHCFSYSGFKYIGTSFRSCRFSCFAVDGTTQLTVFAPTNAAFDTFFAGLGSGVNVNNVDVDVLRQVLLNHVVSGSVQSSQLSTGYINTSATYNGEANKNLSMYVSTSPGVRLNGVSNVVTPNIIASNGVVHVVDAVIGLPTVVTFACS
ncbi:fasciclin domain-containing protein [Flavobacterium piscinae]|uniref:fasciclin domain-containing protein n=1 Tax=Flavobacterium piscinae TaxID=2506424 RepID=UPI002AAC4902|nr:fasciclin domain-containing protein [Flavobacterium piscinae]